MAVVFNDIRAALLDPIGGARRQRMAEEVAKIQGIAGLAFWGAGFLTSFFLLMMRSFPIIAGTFTLLGALTTVGAREVMVLSKNTVDMLNEDFLGKVGAVRSANSFTKRITQDTWVVGPIFGSVIETGLNKA